MATAEFVILDLEWNGTYSRRIKGFMNEIIEFGAVKVDHQLNIIDTYEALVRPQVGKKISGKIRTLTSITNEELEGGLQFMQVASRFRKWVGDAVLLTWGTSDILTLIENCRYFCGNPKIPFLSRYINLQEYCQKELKYDPEKQMGLTTAAQLLKIDEDGFDHHRALGDSLLSLRCLQRLYHPQRLYSLLQVADDEFYHKMTFKTVILCDLNNPLIQPGDMVFYCQACGRRAHRVSDWQLKNKSYRAVFLCKNCRSTFYGRVQFKLKYEGLVVKKCVLPVREDEKNGEPGEKDKVIGVRKLDVLQRSRGDHVDHVDRADRAEHIDHAEDISE